MPSPGNATSSTGSRKRSRTGSCKEPVPKKLLKDPEPGVAPLGPLIVPSLAQRAPRSLFLARPKGTRSRHPYGASSADLSDHLRATRTSSVTLRKLRANLRFTISVLLALRAAYITLIIKI